MYRRPLAGLAALALAVAACGGGGTATAPASPGGATVTPAASPGTPAATTGPTATTAGTTAPAATATATAPAEAVRVTVLSNFTPDVDRGKVLDELIAEFNAQHGGSVEVVSAPDPDWPTLQQKIRSLIAAGTPPDLFIYNYNPNDLSRERSGKLLDWSPYLDADPAWKARFLPENLEAVTVDGQIVGIPSDQAPVLAYYHKDLFDQAGVTSFPATWDEFFAAGDKLKAAGVAPIALMTADDAWHSMNAFTYIAAGVAGPDVFAPGANLDTPQVVQAAEILQRLFQYTTPDAVGANYSVSSQNFLGKRAAMILDGPWLISSIQNDVTDPCTVQVAVGPNAGAVPAGSIVSDSVNYWAGAKQDSQAKADGVAAWMKFFTSEENAKRMSVQGAFPLAVKTTFSEADLAGANCHMAQVLQLSNAAPTKVVSAVRNLTPSAQTALPSLLESLALGQVTPAEFATQLQAANR